MSLIESGLDRTRLRFTQKCDLTKGILVLLATLILQRVTDASRMYHSVRGQETIKLYVIFNVLEVRRPLSVLSLS